MKTFIKILILAFFAFNIQLLSAQAPPPPPPGGTGGTTNQPADSGGGAPIGGGLGILLSLGLAYGATKAISKNSEIE